MGEIAGDFELLQRYARQRDDAAFAEIVRRHVDLVYAAAMRQVRDRHLAEDVSQAVFLILARRATSIRNETHLAPWLHRTTRYAAANAMRVRANREKHEQKAARMKNTWVEEDGVDEARQQLMATELDDAINRLRAGDRTVVAMRFLQGMGLAQLSEKLGITELAARKRVERAVARLREILNRRGWNVPAPILLATLSERMISPAPPGLAAGIGQAVSGAAGAAATVLSRKVLVSMAWGKARVAAMVLVVAAIGVVAIVKASSSTPSASAKPQAASAEKWREDVDALAETIASQHANAFHATSKEDFDRAVAELNRALPGMKDHEVVVGMMKLTSMIGDGHTSLEVPKWFTRYPVSLYWFGDELRVTRTIARHERALGARVVRIGDLDVDETARRVRTVTSQDGDSDAKYFSGVTLPLAEVLHALGITKELAHAAWTFEDANGQFAIEMPEVPQDAPLSWISVPKDPPLYRQRTGEPFWFTTVNDSPGTMYVGWRGYPTSAAFAKLSDELLQRIDAEKVTRVVLDVRQNRGGDFWRGRQMVLGKLAQREQFTKRGSVYVIIGRSTLSAAMVNALDARQNLKAILVGEPTGSRPVGYSENDDFVLPHSKLRLTFSTKFYKFQEQDTDGVPPDQLIEPTWEMHSAGRDAAMEWILAQPAGR